ncbi:MAG: trigger factor [Spirochaetota bacterium]
MFALAWSDIALFGRNNNNNPTLPATKTVEGGLHIPVGPKVSFNPHVMTDGGNFRWDLQIYGTVYNGTNQAYGGAMYCQINGNNVHAHNYGWRNASGDEVEIYDRYSHSRYNNRYRKGLQIFRRIKVYKDRPLARWMDILENPTDKDITVKVTIYSNYYSTFGHFTTNNGDERFSDGDTGLVTSQKHRNNAPAVMHVYCDNKAKVKPKVQKGSSYLNVHYNVTIPAKKTRILVYFQSQGHSHDKLLKRLKQFKAWRELKDLNTDVRKKIVNFGRVSGYADIDLERSDDHDSAIMSNGDPIFGKIANAEFRMVTDYGEVTLPADDVIGMAAGDEKTVEKEYPEDFEDSSLAGQKKSVKITVKAIKERQLPEIDDDLAQDISEKYETIDDLKKDIRDRLDRTVESRLRQYKTDAIVEQVVANSTIAVPESMIGLELENAWRNFVQQFRATEEQVLGLLRAQGKTKEGLLAEWRDGATKRIKGQLVVQKMLENEEIEVSDDEVEAELDRQAESGRATKDQLRQYYEQQNMMDYVRREVRERKLFDKILEETKVKKGEKTSFLDLVGRNE